MGRFALILLLMPVLAAADTWVPLTTDQITQALADKTLRYETGWQRFYASGRTLYHVGHDSWGQWIARGDQYCSQWPPNADWACYRLEQNGDRLRFVGPNGDIIEGQVE